MDQETKDRFERIEMNLEAITKSQLTLQAAVIELTGAVNRYVDSAATRVATMEANLDAMIRAITAEHSNGRKKD